MIDALVRAAPFVAPPAFWGAIADAHATPGRHYHTLEHVREVAERYAEVPTWSRPIDVYLAVLTHDAVYEPGRPDNEARSAELCRHLAERWLGHDGAVAAALVLLTAAHGRLRRDDLDEDARRFLDCDTAVLAAPPGRYAEYARGVAAEYAPLVGAEAWRAGRRAFLEMLLGSERIFLSDLFHGRLDAPARANLRNELEQLTFGPCID